MTRMQEEDAIHREGLQKRLKGVESLVAQLLNGHGQHCAYQQLLQLLCTRCPGRQAILHGAK